jgi:very-short-patch-repair endonuclease/DNA polymerase III delta prime subunit
MALFERLYELKARVDREAERVELVLGDGILDWPVANGAIRHPILGQRVQLLFNPDIPEFSFIDAERAPELYVSLLRSIESIDVQALNRCRQDLDKGYWHPLGGEDTDAFFQRVATQLAPRGEFVGYATPIGSPEAPRIGRDAVIYLRQRTLGFSAFIESILEDLTTRTDLPEAIQNIVGIEAALRPLATDPQEQPTGDNPDGEDETVLLSKEANAEQLRVVQRLERHGSVLVQGPPGTGKTHTIANVIGHLLSEGKSVLVTSHTAKALQVLREKVVPTLQPLCVSVLADSRNQLESSVQGISERLTSDPAQLESDAVLLRNDRSGLLAQLRESRSLIRNARQDEYRPVIYGGESVAPSEAARIVAKCAADSGWIPSPVALGVPLPLTSGELADLYGSNASISVQDEAELERGLPIAQDLMLPSVFAEMIAESNRLSAVDLAYGLDLWSPTTAHQSQGDLDSLQRRMILAVETLDGSEQWRLAAIEAGRDGEPHRKPWDDLLADIEDVYLAASNAHGSLVQHGPRLPDGMLLEVAEEVLDDIIRHLGAGRGLGWLTLTTRRSWRGIIENSAVNNHPPSGQTEFEALRTLARLQRARQSLRRGWDGLMASGGAAPSSDFGDQPELVCRQWSLSIRAALAWQEETWAPLHRELQHHGFQWDAVFQRIAPNVHPSGNLLRIREAVLTLIPGVFEAQANRLRQAEVAETRRRLGRALDDACAGAGDADVVMKLRDAVATDDAEAYRQAYERLSELNQRRILLDRRRALLAKLDSAAPMWANAIRNRTGVHSTAQPPGECAAAWRWRQLNDELDRRASTSLEYLLRRNSDLKMRLRKVTSDLVDRQSWAAQVRRTTLPQRQALHGFAQVMRKIGKGTGKKVPQLRAEAQRLTPICQTAVPVWIMPLARVVETFDPHHNRFDVVIIDEASQADIMALTALYLAKQVIVVGDDKQATPMAVGEESTTVSDLIATYLDGIPNAITYDGRASIYQLAETSFGGPVVLREHFRCVSPIIEFSNQLSYDGRIMPLRDASTVQRVPHTVAYHVAGGVSSGKVNELEAVTVASLLVASTEQPEYAGATYGVISMVGEEQAARIDAILRRRMSFTEYMARTVQCGNAAQFQGDERDVVFLSLVDAPTGNGPLALRREGADDMFKKRFNVAASRARDQMWVIHSVDPDVDLQPDDLRRRLILHARDPYALSSRLAAVEKEAESEFERLVLGRITRAGYTVVPQYQVGAYRIDMVVTGGGKSLAVECDGDRWHEGAEKLAEDTERQAVLERLGWEFVRIRGSQFFRHPDEAMGAVFQRLESIGVVAESRQDSDLPAGTDGDELRQRIVARAEELRQEWAEDDCSLGSSVLRRESFSGASAHSGETRSALSAESRLALPGEPPHSPAGHVALGSNMPSTNPSWNVTTKSRSGGSLDSMTTDQASDLASPHCLDVTSEVEPQANCGFVQARLLPAGVEPPSLTTFLRDKGFEVLDKRRAGGALWVVGGLDLADIMDQLRRQGCPFQFVPGGAKASGHRPAWWTTAKK